MKKIIALAGSAIALAGTAHAHTLTQKPINCEIPVAKPLPDFAAEYVNADANHDSRLTFDEYVSHRVAREGQPTDKMKRHYIMRFGQMDLDGDGELSAQEYATRILEYGDRLTMGWFYEAGDGPHPKSRELCHTANPEPVPDIVAEFRSGDANHDGKLSWDEYVAARRGREGGEYTPAKVNHYIMRFEQMDLNHDMTLNMAEYGARIGEYKDRLDDGRYYEVASGDPKAK
ncbi:hypothetical protein H7F51_14115 [Novosphingobium flavum]|uniref:EF-hand domain-containing protein n=1 Tax=Novosphingobium flavum TaxID=1778672 RepID=A0A7X1FTP5_9SPHN|nr:EF-hand domain-containing protein [Novosphingobium flavum]MBC2666654.1 hypothetical protein [Novosphingobium flavum]